MFKNLDFPKPVQLEIGFGGGEHLAFRALQSPETLFIGAEPFVNGVASLITHIAADNIPNIQIWNDDIHLLLDQIKTKDIFERVYLLFPDPWPKRRHHERRFISDESVKRIHELLIPGGEWFIATDHPDYRDWVLKHLDTLLFIPMRPDISERPTDWPVTRYEQKALAGQASYHIYKKS
jgi:tRNA (guanine-N7-)-methyltransferase